MKDYSFYNRALKLDEKNAGIYYKERAILHFRDMEYDFAWEDFQKALELGVNVQHNSFYEILKLSKSDFDADINNFDFSEKIGYSLISKYVGALLVQKRYSDACVFMGKLMNKYPGTYMYHRKIQDVFFTMKREKYEHSIEHSPKHESIYLWRISLYSENLKYFSKERVKFYRQRINQDFDTLEKISKHPEYICLLRSKYYEHNNEIRYAIKFCRKAVETAKSRSNEGFLYISLAVLKDLYIKNYDYDKALEAAMMLVETKPVPQILAEEVKKFNISNIFHYKLPPELEKYRSYKYLLKKIKNRRLSGKHKSAKAVRGCSKKRGYKNGKDNNREQK